MDLGKATKVLMVKHDMRVADLAKKIEVKRSTMSYLTGNQSWTIAHLINVSAEFGIKASELVAMAEEYE